MHYPVLRAPVLLLFLLLLLPACLSWPSAAEALTFDFDFLGTSSTEANSAFTAAGDIWSSWLTDDVTVSMQVGTATLDPNILGQSGSASITTSYSGTYDLLNLDQSSTYDATAVSSLSTTNWFNMYVNPGDATAYVDSKVNPLSSDANLNNTSIYLTTANAMALGYDLSAYTGYDAAITFSDSFSWDYDPSDGIDAGSYDFVGVAVHEIGHALGFVSGVDFLDGTTYTENDILATSLDLYRYSDESLAEGVIDMTTSETEKYFSIDGGETELALLSTGVTDGDGDQASHWIDDEGIGIMDPTAAAGEELYLTSTDLIAMDVIGWDVDWLAYSSSAAPVPEPSAIALTAVGCTLVMAARRRRAASPA
ncbi:NF038122 family metalloprotease [Chlorobium sp. N1]|uniref:NF038122 family metalloprotease n=1 Tax=Chlorobium sp. N1 TaxID=2491138 RepID=UPI00103B55D8|nr:NF038122 family metalloprotease [Chlorobium sp. N1]TCD47556.1 PEP-CTERM sorting domain-containing protein [Chlorobium sp. N1]